MLRVIIVNVLMLNVVAPQRQLNVKNIIFQSIKKLKETYKSIEDIDLVLNVINLYLCVTGTDAD
jgi:hypothetical protein